MISHCECFFIIYKLFLITEFQEMKTITPKQEIEKVLTEKELQVITQKLIKKI